MKLNKEKKRTRVISRKTVMLFLILLSLATSTGTFAYWADYVEGTFNSHTIEFTIGSLTYQDYEFILYSNSDESEYIIDTEILVDYKYPTGEEINVEFGILWEDENRLNEEGVVARIELSYEVYGEVYGREYNRSKYRRINNLLEITFDESNSDFIDLNSTTETFSLKISANQKDSKRDYKLFDRSQIMIIVSYSIVYEEIIN